MISAVPERLIQDALTVGLKAVKSSPKLLAAIFQNLTEPEFRRIQKFINETPINISLNFPRQQLKLPCLNVTMKGEKEAHPFLGDQLGYMDQLDPEAAAHYIDAVSPPTTLQGPAVKVAGPFEVIEVAGNAILIDTLDYSELMANVRSVQDLKLYVASGAGKGKSHIVRAFENGYIVLEEPTTLMQEGSTFTLRTTSAAVAVGEPQQVYDDGRGLVRLGAIYESAYNIDIMAGSAEEVSYLYYIVKAVIYLTRESLEGQGLSNLTMSGEDMLYRSEFTPDEVFHRVLKLSFKNIFSISIENDIFGEIKVELC